VSVVPSSSSPNANRINSIKSNNNNQNKNYTDLDIKSPKKEKDLWSPMKNSNWGLKRQNSSVSGAQLLNLSASPQAPIELAKKSSQVEKQTRQRWDLLAQENATKKKAIEAITIPEKIVPKKIVPKITAVDNVDSPPPGLVSQEENKEKTQSEKDNNNNQEEASPKKKKEKERYLFLGDKVSVWFGDGLNRYFTGKVVALHENKIYKLEILWDPGSKNYSGKKEWVKLFLKDNTEDEKNEDRWSKLNK